MQSMFIGLQVTVSFGGRGRPLRVLFYPFSRERKRTIFSQGVNVESGNWDHVLHHTLVLVYLVHIPRGVPKLKGCEDSKKIRNKN